MQTRMLQLSQAHTDTPYVRASVCACAACDSVGKIKIAAQQTAETQRGAGSRRRKENGKWLWGKQGKL